MNMHNTEGLSGISEERHAAGQSPHSQHDQEGVIRSLKRMLADEIRSRINAFLQQQKQMVTQRLGSVSEGLRKSSRQMEGGNQKAIARYADLAADKVDSFSGMIEEKDVEALTRDAADFMRKHPALVFGGGIVLGYIAFSIVRSSLEEQGGASAAGAAGYAAPMQGALH